MSFELEGWYRILHKNRLVEDVIAIFEVLEMRILKCKAQTNTLLVVERYPVLPLDHLL